MTWFLNLILYNLYRFEVKTQVIFSYPVFYIFNLKRIRELYKKKGINNPEGEVLKALNCPRHGTNVYMAGIHLLCLEFLFFMGALSTILRLIELEVYFSRAHALITVVITLWFDYRTIHRKKAYLKYYKLFDKAPKKEKILFAWITFFVVVFVWIFGFVFWFTGGLKLHPEYWGLVPIIKWQN